MHGPELIGQRLRQARHWHGWSQAGLASRAGTRSATISAIERGESSGRRVLEQLARALDVDVAWLRLGLGPPAWAHELAQRLTLSRLADGDGDEQRGSYRAAPVGAACLGTVDAEGQLRPALERLPGLPDACTCLRVEGADWARPLQAPALLIVDPQALPAPGQLAVQWLSEQQLLLVRYVIDPAGATGEGTFALVPLDGRPQISIYREGEAPLRLVPVIGVMAEPGRS